MRRPSPLPPDAPATPARENARDAETAATANAQPIAEPAPAASDLTATADLTHAADLAAVRPVAGDAATTEAATTAPGARRPDVGLLPVPAEGAPEESDADRLGLPAGDIGLRDVWKAARARRRALRAEARRFTARQRRRRTVWLVALGALALLVLGSVAVAYSPLFAVDRITVVGAEQLDAAAVEAALFDQLGTPLPLVDESAVKAGLVTFPLVESYTLEARPPRELVVRIVERTPIGLVETAAGYTLVDAAGVALSTTPDHPGGYAVISAAGGVGSVAFTAIGQVMRSLPDDIRALATAVTATTADDVTLVLGATNTRIVWGSVEQSALKAVTLQQMMQNRPPESVRLYDVSSPTAIVVR